MKNAFLIFSLLLLSLYVSAQHTFSIVAVDVVTGEIGSAGATCGDSAIWPGTPGAKLISYVKPGKYAVHTQAYHIAANHQAAIYHMNNNMSPQQAIDWLIANDADSDPSKRQYGIIDYNGGSPRSAGYTGSGCDDYKSHILGSNYAIQGNILLGQQILDSMRSRFLNTQGNLARKLMAALQGANVQGADTRCMQYGTSSLSAFLRVAKPTDADNNLWLDLNVGAVLQGEEPINVLQHKFNLALGIKTDEFSQNNYRLFPNPASGTVNLEFTGNVLPDKIRIFDISGKMTSEITSIKKNTAIDISVLGSGIYFIRFYKDGIASFNDKFIIN